MVIRQRIQESRDNLSRLLESESVLQQIQKAADAMVESLAEGGKIMFCGNGGSAADAQHMAGEFLCRFYKDRKPLPGIALTTDTSSLTAIANDYAYEDVFARQVEALGRAGDILVGISTSGRSKNVGVAFDVAKTKGLKSILISGEAKHSLYEKSDIAILAPSIDTPRIQEMHLIIEHILCEIVEDQATK